MLHFEKKLVRQNNAEWEINGVFHVGSRLPEENEGHSLLLQAPNKLLFLGMVAVTENYSTRALRSSNHNCNLRHILMVDRQSSQNSRVSQKFVEE